MKRAYEERHRAGEARALETAPTSDTVLSAYEEQSSDSRWPSEHIPQLMRIVHADHFPSGDRGALKRMVPQGPAPLAFERLMLRHIAHGSHDGSYRAMWRTVVAALALQRGAEAFSPATRFGAALQQAGYSEARLERLLAADGEALHTLALRAARLLAAKRIACDWREFAELLFACTSAARERINTRTARAYYDSESRTNRSDVED